MFNIEFRVALAEIGIDEVFLTKALKQTAVRRGEIRISGFSGLLLLL